MSTKNLARTVIEGGRRHFNQFERRHSNQVARVRTRAALARFASSEHAEAEADELLLEPRRSVGREFHDKLGPVERWLAAQAGRPFRKVHEELFGLFDIRTLAERHVVLDHLLPGRFLREDGTWTVHRRIEFSIDRHGILRARRRNRRAERRPWVDARNFAGFRRVRRDPNGYVWVEIRWAPPKWERTFFVVAPLDADELKGLFALSREALQIVLVE